MALIEDSCLRGCKGKVGGLVVYRLGDRTVVRTVGERESGEFSEGQRAQQERLFRREPWAPWAGAPC